jgi:uncharacterized membrane protein
MMTKKEQAEQMMRWMEAQGYSAATMIACLEFAVELFRVVEEVKAKEQDQ